MAENPNPLLVERKESKNSFKCSIKDILDCSNSENDNFDDVDEYEVFDLIRDIKDPEHPYSIECLKIVEIDRIKVENTYNVITVIFRPTIPHCSQATLIGLMIYLKIRQNVPIKYKIFVQIEKGFHDNDEAINKQLADKERVSAALENNNLMRMIDEAIYGYVPPDIIDISI